MARSTQTRSTKEQSGATRSGSARSGGARASKGQSKTSRTGKQTGASRLPAGVAIVVGTVVALAIVCAMLYGPLCSWYAAWRNNLRLRDSYEQTLDEQTELQGDVDRLRTREGIVDEAHKKGLVDEGETRVIVENLPKDETTADAAPEEGPDDPWYLRVLDTIFGYEG